MNADDIAIIGLGCRLPGGIDSPEALWQGLLDGIDAIGEVPRSGGEPMTGMTSTPRRPAR